LEARHVRRRHGRRGVVLAAGRMGEHGVLHGWQLVQGSFHGDLAWPASMYGCSYGNGNLGYRWICCVWD
jgi:hypothetical protein